MCGGRSASEQAHAALRAVEGALVRRRETAVRAHEPADPSESEPDPLSADADAAFEAERDAELRSFFAQPLPLKWIVGAETAFRTGEAPQMGHVVGPSAVTEWMTSNRWPFGQR